MIIDSDVDLVEEVDVCDIDFGEMDEDGFRYKWIDGEIEVSMCRD
ncbi:hypothetical protein [Staphylococcus hominis]|nr:hypothetical protein [Staphylococcus hominis]